VINCDWGDRITTDGGIGGGGAEAIASVEESRRINSTQVLCGY
jgi:hypothetical protein